MDEINKQGIFLLDIYMLDYYGVKVFFQVCKTTENSVFLVELATKRYKNGIMLTKNLNASKNPYIILNNNTRTKSTYEVSPTKLDTNEYMLPIEVKINSKLYLEAQKHISYPIYGTAYAVHIKDYLNKYWINEQEKTVEKIALA